MVNVSRWCPRIGVRLEGLDVYHTPTGLIMIDAILWATTALKTTTFNLIPLRNTVFLCNTHTFVNFMLGRIIYTLNRVRNTNNDDANPSARHE